MIRIFLILFVLISSLGLNAQTDSVKTFYLPQLYIYQKTNGKKITYSFDENESNMFTVTDSLLKADPKIYNFKVNLSDITKISIKNGTRFWKGVLWGGIVGFAVGAILVGSLRGSDGPSNFHIEAALLGGVVLAIPVGLIGGLFGLLKPNYDVYNL